MSAAAAFYYLIPGIYLAFALALTVIAVADRSIISARWGAATLLIVAVALILDAARPENDQWLRYLAVVLHFAAIYTGAAAWMARKRLPPPRSMLVLALVSLALLSPVSPIGQVLVSRIIALHGFAIITLTPILALTWGWRKDSAIDRMISIVVLFNTLAYLPRPLMLFAIPSDPAAQPAFFETNLILGQLIALTSVFAFGIVLMLAIGLDALAIQRRQASTDELTGIGNRRAMTQAIRQHRSGDWRCGAVIVVDLDHFKHINDRHGHDAGDRVLRDAGAALARALGSSGRLFRTGGEEFVALVDHAFSDQVTALAMAARREMATVKLRHDAGEDSITASFGVHRLGPDERDVEAAVRQADQAVYRAKAEGRDRVVATFDEGGLITLRSVA